ncbi:hypothetical protein N7490_002083 [Penicillium lividum]|nr:hypothetical protein N7490_002083 [Penicillium lividum]
MSDAFGLPENRKAESEAHTRVPKGQAICENDHPFRALYAALKKSGKKFREDQGSTNWKIEHLTGQVQALEKKVDFLTTKLEFAEPFLVAHCKNLGTSTPQKNPKRQKK